MIISGVYGRRAYDSTYEEYSELDELGRCQSAEACIGQDLMPTESEGEYQQCEADRLEE